MKDYYSYNKTLKRQLKDRFQNKTFQKSNRKLQNFLSCLMQPYVKKLDHPTVFIPFISDKLFVNLHHVAVKSIPEGFGPCSSQAFFIPVLFSKRQPHVVWRGALGFCISDRRDMLPNLKCWRARQPSSGSGISFYASQNQDAKSFIPEQSQSLCKRTITLPSQYFS